YGLWARLLQRDCSTFGSIARRTPRWRRDRPYSRRPGFEKAGGLLERGKILSPPREKPDLPDRLWLRARLLSPWPASAMKPVPPNGRPTGWPGYGPPGPRPRSPLVRPRPGRSTK